MVVYRKMTRVISNGYNMSMNCYMRMKLLELKTKRDGLLIGEITLR